MLCCVVVFFVEWELLGFSWPRKCHSETIMFNLLKKIKRIVYVL